MSLQIRAITYPNITIVDGPGGINGLPEVEILASRSALHVLKTSLSPTQMMDILEPSIAQADDFWHDLVSQSQGGAMVPADVHISISSPGLNVSSFLAWYTSHGATPEFFLPSHPEAYWGQTSSNSDGSLRVDGIQGYDGHVTRFFMPTFGPPDRTKYPFLRPMADYPTQVGGPLDLLDNTEWGLSHSSFRDPDNTDGVELYTTTWLPSKSPQSLILDLRRHTMLMWVNSLIDGAEAVGSGATVARREDGNSDPSLVIRFEGTR